jgi:hypothetical protein
MLGSEPLCLSTQTVISLRLKLKRELNALLPARVGLRAPAFEYSNRNFLRLKSMLKHAGFRLFLLNSARLLSEHYLQSQSIEGDIQGFQGGPCKFFIVATGLTLDFFYRANGDFRDPIGFSTEF